MSSVSEGQANEELGPFDLSKMTPREIAAELVRRSHPTPAGGSDHPDADQASPPQAQTELAQTEPPETHPADVSAAEIAPEPVNPPDYNQDVGSKQDVIVPLPTFLREGDRLTKTSGWEWPTDHAEMEERDPLDVLSRALHNHLQERQSEELASGGTASGSAPLSPSREISTAEPLNPSPANPSPANPSPANPSPAVATGVAPIGPAVAAETSWPPALSSARLSDSLDIPVQPSSMHRPPNADLPASLSPGIKFAAEIAAEPAVSEPGTHDTTRPGIRRIRSSDRATERAKVVAQLWLASASAQASTYAARLHLGRKPRPDGGTTSAAHNAAVAAPEVNVPDVEVAVDEAAMVDAPMAMIPSSIVSEDLVPERTGSVRKAMAARLAWARRSLGEGALGKAALGIGARRLNWRRIHWEAVAGGMLLGIVLTIGPAIYFLTAPGRSPALTVIAPPENQPSAVTSSVEPSSAMTPAVPQPTTSAAQMEPPPPPPPTILQSDPTALATAAGGTSAVAKAAALQTPGSQSATAATPEAVGKTPPVKPAAQKASTKKQKAKAGTVSAHQSPATVQLSPAKR